MNDILKRKHEQVGKKEPLWGSFIAFVRDTADPEGRARVRFYCPEVMGDEDTPDSWTPWALPKAPLAGFDQGVFAVPASPTEAQRDPNGTSKSPYRKVAYWIEFRNGDPRFPIYTGGFWFKETDLPNHAPVVSDGNNGGDETQLPPTGAQKVRQVTPSIDENDNVTYTERTVNEPPPAAETVYPLNRFFKSPSGHLVEFDDTPNAERVRVYHRQGTYFEIDPASSLVTKVVGQHFMHIQRDELYSVVGACTHVFKSSRNVQVDGPAQEVFRGAKTTVVDQQEKHYTLAEFLKVTQGKHTVRANSFSVESMSSMDLLAADNIGLASQDVNVMAANIKSVGALTHEVQSLTGMAIQGPSLVPAGFVYNQLALSIGWGSSLAAFAASLVTDPAVIAEIAGMPNFIARLSALFTAWSTLLGTAVTPHRVTL